MALAEHFEEEIVVGMYDRELISFFENGIVLESGRTSPYFINMRPATSFNRYLAKDGRMSLQKQAAFRDALGKGWAETIADSMPFDHVFGKAQAVTALGMLAAGRGEFSYIWERVPEQGKDYGQHKLVEGDCFPGETVCLVDDVLSTSRSKLKGLGVLREVGVACRAVSVILDRQEGGDQALEELGLNVYALTTLTRASQFLLANGRIGNQELDALQAYHESLRAEGKNSTFERPTS